MWCSDREARFARRAEVGLKCLGDAVVGLGYTVFEDTYMVVSVNAQKNHAPTNKIILRGHWLTCPLVNAQQRYPRASAPCCYLADIIDQPFQPCIALFVVALVQFENNAEVVRQFS